MIYGKKKYWISRFWSKYIAKSKKWNNKWNIKKKVSEIKKKDFDESIKKKSRRSSKIKLM